MQKKHRLLKKHSIKVDLEFLLRVMEVDDYPYYVVNCTEDEAYEILGPSIWMQKADHWWHPVGGATVTGGNKTDIEAE